MLGFNLVFSATLLAPLCQLRSNLLHIHQPALGRVILYACEVAQVGVVQNVRIGAQPVREVLDQGSSVSMLFQTRKRRVSTVPRGAIKHGSVRLGRALSCLALLFQCASLSVAGQHLLELLWSNVLCLVPLNFWRVY